MTSTTVDTKSPFTLLNRRISSSSATTAPPDYDNISLQPLSTTSSTASLPEYESIVTSSTFTPTVSLQIETAGHPLISLPLPPRPHPINIYAVPSSSGEPSSSSTPAPALGPDAVIAYRSLRSNRNSGNCTLHVGEEADPICTTTYRFGPGKPPVIHLLTPSHTEDFEVRSIGGCTRSQSIRTHLGTFQWRYAGKKEKQEEGADNLLVFEKVVLCEDGGKKPAEKRTRVAQLVRNAELRSQGSRRSTAGNGGRLMMDLREWTGKGEQEEMEVLIVAGVVCMLKKEVDRRRMHQAIAIGAGVSGGGS